MGELNDALVRTRRVINLYWSTFAINEKRYRKYIVGKSKVLATCVEAIDIFDAALVRSPTLSEFLPNGFSFLVLLRGIGVI